MYVLTSPTVVSVVHVAFMSAGLIKSFFQSLGALRRYAISCLVTEERERERERERREMSNRRDEVRGDHMRKSEWSMRVAEKEANA